MSSFQVRRVSQHSQPQKLKQALLIEPTKILFQTHQQANKINIVKVLLTNTSNSQLEYQIKQPREHYLKVKYNKTTLQVNQSNEIFVFFNLESNVCQCDIFDQFVVLVNGGHVYTVTVPIFVRSVQEKRMEGSVKKKPRRESKSKENFRLMKIGNPNRTVGEKRFAGVAITNYRKLKCKEEPPQVFSFSNRIEKFQRDFLNIKNFLKSKAIKCQVFIGEKPFTRQKSYEIISFNLTTQLMAKDIMKQQILSLHMTKKSKNGPSIRIFEFFKLQWNKNRNQPQITYKKGLEKLFRQVRSFVIYHRFKKMNKTLAIYRNLRHEENIQQPQTKIINNKFDLNLQETEPKTQYSNQYDQDRQYEIQIEQKKKHDYYCRKISKIITNKKERNLGADFAQFTLVPKALPMNNQFQKNHTFEIKPRIGFDNWVALEELPSYDHEIFKFQKMEGIKKWQCHPFFQPNHKSQMVNKIKLQTSWQNNQSAGLKLSKRQRPVDHGNEYQQVRDFFDRYINTEQKYKNYQKQPQQIDFLSQNDQKNLQLDARKPCKQNLKAIVQIKISKQEYLPYFSAPQPSFAYNLINAMHLPDLMYSIKKQDKINYDQQEVLMINKIESMARSQEIGELAKRRSLKGRISAQKQQEDRYSLPTEEQEQLLYERVTENINKTKMRKLNNVDSKMASINKFVKNDFNILYF